MKSIITSRVNISWGGINQQLLLCQFLPSVNIDHSGISYDQRNSIWGQYTKLQYG